MNIPATTITCLCAVLSQYWEKADTVSQVKLSATNCSAGCMSHCKGTCQHTSM